MGTLDNSNDSKSIYDITRKIEEELTYIYEMRMKTSSLNKEIISEKNNPVQNDVLKNNQNIPAFVR